MVYVPVMTNGVSRERGWKRPVLAYIGLSGIALLVGEAHWVLPTAVLPPLFLVLGPSAWLLWGFAMTPFYLLATAVFAACLIGATFVRLHSSGVGRFAFWFVGIVWLLLGLAAWRFSV